MLCRIWQAAHKRLICYICLTNYLLLLPDMKYNFGLWALYLKKIWVFGFYYHLSQVEHIFFPSYFFVTRLTTGFLGVANSSNQEIKRIWNNLSFDMTYNRTHVTFLSHFCLGWKLDTAFFRYIDILRKKVYP